MNQTLYRAELGLSSQALISAGKAGVLELPAQINAAVGAFERAGAARHAHQSVDLEAARSKYADEVAESLRRDTGLPPAKTVEKVAAQAQSHEETQRALVAAEIMLIGELRASIPPADEVVSGLVRPAMLAAYDEARTLIARHGAVLGEAADAAISGPPALASAWTAFGILVSRISGLRDLHHRLTAPSLTMDTTGAFATWTEPPTDDRLWGRSPVRLAERWRPWPSDSRAFTAWLLRSGLTVWVPTAEEQDARHADVFAAPSPNPDALLTAVGFA
jgi:hypothetical protein